MLQVGNNPNVYPLKDFLYGTLCGDSNIEIKSETTARLTVQDNNNPEYMEWKVSKLSPFFKFHKKVRENGLVAYVSESTEELYSLKQIFHNRTPLPMLITASPLSLALWVADDGYLQPKAQRYEISFARFVGDEEMCEKIRLAARRHHLDFSVNVKSGIIVFTKFSTEFLNQRIYRFVPPCMNYKLLESYRGKYHDFQLSR